LELKNVIDLELPYLAPLDLSRNARRTITIIIITTTATEISMMFPEDLEVVEVEEGVEVTEVEVVVGGVVEVVEVTEVVVVVEVVVVEVVVKEVVVVEDVVEDVEEEESSICIRDIGVAVFEVPFMKAMRALKAALV